MVGSRVLGTEALRVPIIALALVIVLAFVWNPQAVRAAPAAGGEQLWVARHSGQYGTDVAVSPNGSRVYVTGVGATVAYDASTGTRIWQARFSGMGNAVAVHPDGSVVFVTGLGRASEGDFGDYDTIAYEAATGRLLWRAIYDAGSRDYPCCLAVSPSGRRVYVTGESWSNNSYFDYATVAYDARTGSAVWISRYAGPSGYDDPHAIGVSRDGLSVFVTGESPGASPSIRNDYGTVAYDANTGTQVWFARYNSGDARGDTAYSLAVDPGGRRVYVTGCSGVIDYCVESDIVTIAYDDVSGQQDWLARFGRTPGGIDFGRTIVASPAGDTVYIAGSTQTSQAPDDVRYAYALLAYNASTGEQRWIRFHQDQPSSSDVASDAGVAQDGSQIFVTGSSTANGESDYSTIAFEATSGEPLWTSRYDGPGHIYDFAYALAVNPDGTALYVTGESLGLQDYQFATVAYRS